MVIVAAAVEAMEEAAVGVEAAMAVAEEGVADTAVAAVVAMEVERRRRPVPEVNGFLKSKYGFLECDEKPQCPPGPPGPTGKPVCQGGV